MISGVGGACGQLSNIDQSMTRSQLSMILPIGNFSVNNQPGYQTLSMNIILKASIFNETLVNPTTLGSDMSSLERVQTHL